jgi:uncharacterized protein (DUF1800 family)
MPDREIALNRFGLGARGGEAAISDPRNWLKAQLRGFDSQPQTLRALPTRSDIAAQLADSVEALKAMGGKKAKTCGAQGGAPRCARTACGAGWRADADGGGEQYAVR